MDCVVEGEGGIKGRWPEAGSEGMGWTGEYRSEAESEGRGAGSEYKEIPKLKFHEKLIEGGP